MDKLSLFEMFMTGVNYYIDLPKNAVTHNVYLQFDSICFLSDVSWTQKKNCNTLTLTTSVIH